MPVRQLVLYGGGVHITVGGPTTGADEVFLKLKEILLSMGVREPVTPPIKFYRSTLVCDFDKSFDAVFAKYADLISAIQGKGGLPEAPIHGTGIAFAADPTTIPTAMATYNPTQFSINRKTDVPFSTNRFTCFANMATADHVAVLEQIERLL